MWNVTPSIPETDETLMPSAEATLRLSLLLAAATLLATVSGARSAGFLDAARACRADRAALCRDVAIGGGAVRACLRAHLDAVSTPCRDALLASADAVVTPSTSASSALRNLAYGPDPKQRLDVYRPTGAHGAPVLFMVHGGAWAIGDKEADAVVDAKVAHVLPNGWIFVSVDYRLLPAAAPATQAEDVARALAYAQSRAAEWGGDPNRFVLMGHSAGAHLVALLTADPSLADRFGARPWRGTVALDSAVYDVPALMNTRHLRLYDRAFGTDPAGWTEVSPRHRLRGRPVPMLLICSSRRADACPQASAFAATARSHGGDARVFPTPKSHREINRDLGAPGAETEAVDAFLASVVR